MISNFQFPIEKEEEEEEEEERWRDFRDYWIIGILILIKESGRSNWTEVRPDVSFQLEIGN